MGKVLFVVVVVVIGGIGYYMWQTIETAPQDATLPGYTQSLKNDEDKARQVMGHANVDTVRAAITNYKSQKGTLPASLQDLVPDFIDHIPGGVQYDPATGNVSPQ